MVLPSGWVSMQSLGMVAAEILWKATLVLGATAAIAWVMRRASASARHLIWSVGVAATLALPVAVILVPSWRVAVLPAPLSTTPDLSGIKFEGLEASSAAAAAAAAAVAAAAAGSSSLSNGPALVSPNTFSNRRFTLPTLGAALFGGWLFGVVALIAWVVSGLFAVRWLAHRARPVQDREWLGITEDVRAALGLHRSVVLLQSHLRGLTPMTFGIFSSAVLLPSDSTIWDAGRKRVVLLHELAHIARRDVLVQLMAQLTCALYWFHPLVWYAARQLRSERERACDDAVVNAGERPSEYAMHLLNVARSYSATSLLLPAALAMARRNQLEGRLLAVLKPGLKRAQLSRRRIAGSAATAFAVVLPLSALTPSPRPAVHREVMRPVQQATVIRHPRAADPIEAKWQWAFDEASKHATRRGFWVGYSIQRITRASEGYISGSNGFDLDDLNDTPLQTQLFGTRPARYDAEQRVPRDVAILFQFAASANDASDARAIRMHSMHLGLDLGRLPVLWLGEISDEQSIRWLEQQYAAASPAWIKDELIEAVGVHQRADLAVPFLRGILENEPAVGLRAQAAEALGEQGSADAVRALEELIFDDGDVGVQRQATEALGAIPDDLGVAALRRVVRAHPRWEIRAGAAETLADVSPSAALPILQQVIADEQDKRVVEDAVEALGDLGSIAIRTLREIAREHPDREIRMKAAEALADASKRNGDEPDSDIDVNVPSPAVDPRRNPTGERLPIDFDVSQLITPSQARSARDAKAIITLMANLESDPKHDNDLVSHRAAWALSLVRNGEVVGPLIDALRDEDWRVRAYAGWALAVAKDPRATNALLAAAEDEHWRVRNHALWALGEIDSGARGLDALIRGLDDEMWQVRAIAAQHIGDVAGGEKAVGELQRVVADSHLAVSGTARESLRKIAGRR